MHIAQFTKIIENEWYIVIIVRTRNQKFPRGCPQKTSAVWKEGLFKCGRTYHIFVAKKLKFSKIIVCKQGQRRWVEAVRTFCGLGERG